MVSAMQPLAMVTAGESAGAGQEQASRPRGNCRSRGNPMRATDRAPPRGNPAGKPPKSGIARSTSKAMYLARMEL
jgi:hypothetical protein